MPGRRARRARPRDPRSAPAPSRGTRRGRRPTSATFSDCSTRMIVMPSAFSRSITLSSSWTTSGASPSESSSMASTSGSWSSVIASASICCCPPDSCDAALPSPFGERGEQVVGAVEATLEVGVVAAVHERRHLEVLVHRHRREHALAAEEDADAELRPLLGRGVGDVPTVEAHDAARRSAEAGDGAQDRRLPRTVGAEQREHLAAMHLEADVEQHLDRPVGEVDVGDLERRDLRRRPRAGACAPPSPPAARRPPARGRCG